MNDQNEVKPYGSSTSFICKGCSRSFRSTSALKSHERICPQMKMGSLDSFFRRDPLQTPTSIEEGGEKVLPLSQPLQESNTVVNPTIDIREEQLNQANEASDSNIADRNGDDEEDNFCPLCKEEVMDGQDSVKCDMCEHWSHKICLNMTDEEFATLSDSENDTHWYCARCLAIRANRISWGAYEGEERISQAIKSLFNEILNWKKNFFALPRGKVGEDLIKELTRLINLFVRNTEWERLALSLVHVFLPVMLQKPNAKSKPRDHTRYLKSRLQRWMNGELDSLMTEAKEIQKRMMKSSKKEETKEKALVKLMMLGKIKSAAKFVNSDDSVKGVHPLNEEIKEILQAKHPAGKDADPSVIYECTAESPEPVIYEGITAEKVQQIAKNMNGSGGPTLIDTDVWKDILCSKVFGNKTEELSQSIADLAKKLCTEEIHPDCLVEYNACRLIPLDKGLTKQQTPGVRPIGIGEVLKRIVGKLLIGVIKDDIIEAVGPLQTCSGLKGGIEAAIHAMRRTYECNSTEGMLLVDAENAFNFLNRKVALQNIKQICPPLYRYLSNTYQSPAKLVIQGDNKHEMITSEEGCIQGDVPATGLYGLGIKPLIDNLAEVIDIQKCVQSWFADDSSAAGQLKEMKKW